MRIATWNVNSIRSRTTHVLEWLAENPVDVLCLQETKALDDQFPFDDFTAAGYQVSHHGQKTYNGVALITPKGVEQINVMRGFPTGDLNEQTRVISAQVGDVRIVNVYCPQGFEVGSAKFEFKEAFYGELLAWLQGHFSPDDKLLICGDFNIAPEVIDVYKAEKATPDRVMFTPMEHAWLKGLFDWGLIDAFRDKFPDEVKFSWWDYRQLGFQQNRGWRIDYHLITPPLRERVLGVEFYRDERKKEKPSDHIPVVLELATA